MRLLPFLKKRNAPNPFAYPDDDDIVRATHAGVRVTPETALQLGAVYACVRVLSETIASIPLLTYKQTGEERKLDRTDPLYVLLVRRPNPWMTAFDFFRLMMCYVLLRGNAYAEIIFKSGNPVMLVPLHPARVTVKLEKNGRKTYKFRTTDGTARDIPMERMLHFKGMSSDGVTGISVIDDVARQSVALGLAQEEYGARSFGQRANIAGVLHHPGKLDDAAHKRITDSWNKTYSGIQNSHKVAITEEGMKFEPISMTNENAQFLEARKFQVEEICRIFRVPPHKIMDLSNAHYNNLEHSNADFREGLVPFATCIEQEIDYILIGPEEMESRFVRFNLNALLRADTLTRAQVQNLRLQNGMQSINEARQEEDWNPIGPEGDDHRIQLNMGAAGGEAAGNPADPGAQPAKDKKPAKDQPAPKKRSLDRDYERMRYAYIRTLEDAIARVCRREATELRSKAGKGGAGSRELLLELPAKFEKLLSESIRSSVFAWVESIIFYENARSEDELGPQKLIDSAGFAATLSNTWALEHKELSESELENLPPAGDIEEVCANLERNRPRKEAEYWIERIERDVQKNLKFVEVKT